MNYSIFYELLFKSIEVIHGKLDGDTITSIIGFNASGPVSMCSIKARNIFVTCELAVYSEQKQSSDGINYELLSVGHFDEDTARAIFTALGNFSFGNVLGDGHTIDISALKSRGSLPTVQMALFCKEVYQGKPYGIYMISPIF